MERALGDRLREVLAARHAPRAGRVEARPTTRSWLVPLADGEASCAGLASDGARVRFGAVGPAVAFDGVVVEPGERAEQVVGAVETVASRPGWTLLELRLAARAGCAEVLRAALIDAPRLEVGFRSDAANAGRMRLALRAAAPRLVCRPEVVDLGELSPVGEHTVMLGAPGRAELVGPTEREDIVVDRPGRARLALGDGLYQLRQPDGSREEILLLRHRREVELFNAGELALRVSLVEAPPGIRVAPTELRLAPGEGGRVRLRCDPGSLALAGEAPAIVLDAGGERVELPVRLRVRSDHPVLVVEADAVELPRLAASQGRAVVRLPFRMFGAGRLSVTLRLVDANGQAVERPVVAEQTRELFASEDGCRRGELELEVDLAQALLDGGERYGVVVETDTRLVNLRRQRVPLRLRVVGRLLASRAMELDAVSGLAYAIPLSFHVRGKPVAAPLEVTGGVPEELRPVLSGLDPAAAESLPWATVTERQTAPSRRGFGPGIEPVLLLDLRRVRMTEPREMTWPLRLADPSTGLTSELELTLRLRPLASLLREVELVPAGEDGRPAEVRFALVNPLDRAYRVTAVSLRGDPLPGLAPLELAPSAELAPGAEQRFRLPVALPATDGGGWWRRLLGKGHGLALSIATDLGERVLERRIELG